LDAKSKETKELEIDIDSNEDCAEARQAAKIMVKAAIHTKISNWTTVFDYPSFFSFFFLLSSFGCVVLGYFLILLLFV
jgi:hypothetical protein